MIRKKLLECNFIERAEDEVTATAGLIMFDGFMKGDYPLKLCKYTTPPEKFANIAKKAL